MTELKATFKPVTEVEIGERLVGGIVRAIRYSKSGKTIYFTMEGPRGTSEWPGQSTVTQTAVFTEE